MNEFLVWIACYCVFCLNLLMHSRKELDFRTDTRPTNTSHQLANNKAYRSPSTLSIGTGCSFASSIKSTCLGLKPAYKKKCKLLTIRLYSCFTIDVWQGTGFHKAITVPCIIFLQLQHVHKWKRLVCFVEKHSCNSWTLLATRKGRIFLP